MSNPSVGNLSSLPVPDGLRLHRGDMLVMGILSATVLVTRLAYMPVVIAHADGAEYAFALDDFDIANGHPHAPGYPLFVVLAKVLYLTIAQGDANRALVLTSTLLSAGACCALYWWGTVMFGRICGLAAAVLLCFDNNFWRLGDMWMSYTAGPLWGSLLGLACFRALQGRPRWTTIGAVFLGIGGGFRQQLLTFLGPMWLWSARRSRWRQVVAGVLIIGALTAAWICGASYFSGGYGAYKASSQSQWQEAIYPWSVFYALQQHGPGQALRVLAERISNWQRLLLGGNLHLTVLAWLLPAIYAVGRIFRPIDIMRDDRSQLLLWWLVTVTLFHWTIHMTSRCHAAIYYPALFTIAGAGISLLCRDLQVACRSVGSCESTTSRRTVRLTALTAIALIACWNIGLFMVRTGPVMQAEARGVKSVIDYIKQNYSPERTIIVQSDKRMFFYAVQYYLPGYTSYQLEQTLSPPRPSLAVPSPIKLPPQIDTVVFLNPDARVAGKSRRVDLAEGYAVRIKHLRRYQRYMHFSPAGVAFWSRPQLPPELAIYSRQSPGGSQL